jgi:hemoglobin
LAAEGNTFDTDRGWMSAPVVLFSSKYEKKNTANIIQKGEAIQTQRLFSRTIASLLTLILLASWSAACAIAQEKPQQSLYKRLGGYDAIAAVVDDFLGRAGSDKQLSRFLVGLSTESKKKLRQLIVDQLCEATGGPCLYTGRSTKAAHAGLGITESDWQVTVKYLAAIMNKFGVPQKERDEFLALASTLKGDIVEK